MVTERHGDTSAGNILVAATDNVGPIQGVRVGLVSAFSLRLVLLTTIHGNRRHSSEAWAG